MKLGDILVHSLEGPNEVKATLVAIKNPEDELVHYLNPDYCLDEVNELLEESDKVYYVETGSNKSFYDEEEFIEYDEDDEFGHLIPLEDYNERKEIEDKILAVLIAAKINTNDLIVSDGHVYVGYDECYDYINGTRAWCSSSMSC